MNQTLIKSKFKNLENLCSKHIILFSKKYFKFQITKLNGRNIEMIDVDQFEIKDGDSKVEAAQKEISLKKLVYSTHINRGEPFQMALYKRKAYK